MAALFISDLHLSHERPAVVDLFLGFLEGPVRKASTLYILGDLFEYWAGDDDLSAPLVQRIVTALSTSTATGTQIFFMRGNRDFLIGDRFAQACGLHLLDDPSTVELADGPVLLSHGDTLCTDDAAYQAFRATVRSTNWTSSFLARPLSERKHEIETLRMRSEFEKRGKSALIMDVNAAAVSELLRTQHARRLIHGHTHRLARHEHLVDGRLCERWVLGDWYDSGNYLCSDSKGLRAIDWHGN